MARGSARLVAAAALASLLAIAGAGCSTINELIQLQDRIERQGYDVSNAFHNDFGRGTNEVLIEATTNRGTPPPDGTEEIAGIVWQTYPRRFDTVAVHLDRDQRVFSRGDLQEAFGPRDARLDEKEFSEDVRSGIRTIAIGALVVVGLSVAAIVTVVVLVRRSRRRNPPPPMPPPPPGYYPPPPRPSSYPPPPPPSYPPPPPPGPPSAS